MNLTREQQNLLETEFPAEIEKEAAETAETLGELYDVGFVKMAAAAADAMDEKEEEEEEEEKEKPENKLDEGQKKEAAARGAFLARYYVEGLLKEGSERRGDELYYLYPFLEDALVKAGASKEKSKGFFQNLKEKSKKMYGQAEEKAKKGWGAVKEYHQKGVEDIKKGFKGWETEPAKKGLTKAEAAEKKKLMESGIPKSEVSKAYKAHKLPAQKAGLFERAKLVGKGGARFIPHAAALAALGYGAHRALSNKEEGAPQE